MAGGFTGTDAIALHLTGVLGSADAGTVAGALGGARMGQEVMQVEALISGFMPTVIVEQIGGACGEGAGTLRAVSTTQLAFAAPGEDEGDAVTVADGGAYVVESETAGKYVRVRIEGDDDLGDAFDLNIIKAFNNLIGMGNVSTAESAAGADHYAAGMFTNPGEAVVNATVYLGTLGAARTTGAAQLGGAGSGTIGTGTANGFAEYLETGWAKIVTSGGATREIVYYESRTATVLNVPANGRGLLGTTAAAGAADDTVVPVPGLRFALEAPDAEGMIQEIADNTTAPSGVSWSTATTSAAGLTISTLAPLENYGLWLHREIPPGAKASVRQESVLVVEVNGTTQRYCGLFRIAEAGAAMYSIWKGADARPDLTAAPDATHAALPFTMALAAPVSGQRDYYLVTRYTDEYGLTSYNSHAQKVTLDSAGNQLNATITPPGNVSLTELGSGYVQLRATYNHGVDASNADYFRYYLTDTGVDPDPGVDTPVDVATRIGQGVSGQRILNERLGPFDWAADVRVIVRMYRSGDTTESDNLDVVSAVIALTAPPVPGRPVFAVPSGDAVDSGAAFDWDTEAISGSVVFWRFGPGVTELWANTNVLVLRALAGGVNQVTLHFGSDWSLIEGAVSGTGVAGAIEAASATLLYVCVGGQRRAKIDLTAKEITAPAFIATGAIAPEDAPVVGPTVQTSTFTGMQVYDVVAGRWRSAMCVDSSGNFSARWLAQRKS